MAYEARKTTLWVESQTANSVTLRLGGNYGRHLRQWDVMRDGVIVATVQGGRYAIPNGTTWTDWPGSGTYTYKVRIWEAFNKPKPGAVTAGPWSDPVTVTLAGVPAPQPAPQLPTTGLIYLDWWGIKPYAQEEGVLIRRHAWTDRYIFYGREGDGRGDYHWFVQYYNYYTGALVGESRVIEFGDVIWLDYLAKDWTWEGVPGQIYPSEENKKDGNTYAKRSGLKWIEARAWAEAGSRVRRAVWNNKWVEYGGGSDKQEGSGRYYWFLQPVSVTDGGDEGTRRVIRREDVTAKDYLARDWTVDPWDYKTGENNLLPGLMVEEILIESLGPQDDDLRVKVNGVTVSDSRWNVAWYYGENYVGPNGNSAFNTNGFRVVRLTREGMAKAGVEARAGSIVEVEVFDGWAVSWRKSLWRATVTWSDGSTQVVTGGSQASGDSLGYGGGPYYIYIIAGEQAGPGIGVPIQHVGTVDKGPFSASFTPANPTNFHSIEVAVATSLFTWTAASNNKSSNNTGIRAEAQAAGGKIVAYGNKQWASELTLPGLGGYDSNSALPWLYSNAVAANPASYYSTGPHFTDYITNGSFEIEAPG